MKFIHLSVVIIVLLSVTSCNKEYLPYVTFKKSNYKTIKKDVVDVDLNSDYYLIVENGYESAEPVFAIQKNNEPEQIISNSAMITQESQGWNGKKGLIFKVVRVHLNFNSNKFNSGDELKVFSRHSGISEFLTFKVK